MQISEQRLQTISLLTLAVIGCGVVLRLLQNVFIPFVLGGFLALGLSPLVNFQARMLRFPVTLAVTTTICLTLLLFWLGGLIVSASVEQLAASAPVYEDQLIELVHDILGTLPLERLHLSSEQLMAPLQHFPIENLILDITNSFLHALSLALLTFVFTAYLLVLLSGRTRTFGVWSEIESRIKDYLVAKIIVSVVAGLIIGLALFLAGVRFALLFGLITGLLNFIPYLGPIIGALADHTAVSRVVDRGKSVRHVLSGDLILPGWQFFRAEDLWHLGATTSLGGPVGLYVLGGIMGTIGHPAGRSHHQRLGSFIVPAGIHAAHRGFAER